MSVNATAQFTVKHAEFDAGLRQLVPTSGINRPFLCLGDPLAAEVFIVLLHPATDTPFWPYWNVCVFDKKAWLEDYLRRHNGRLKTTRRYLERLIDGLDGVPYLETNLSPYPSSQESGVLDFLITSIRPRVMLVMGKETIHHACRRAGIVELPKDESFRRITWLGVTLDVMADNCFTHPSSWNNRKVDRVATALKNRCVELCGAGA